MSKYRSDLPPLPARMAHLPLDDRGYPLPWFVAKVNGKPDPRVMDARKRILAIATGCCWVCGRGIAPDRAVFVIGPMCLVNRVSAEPPSHRECAEYSVRACPFLSRPHAKRRENDLPGTLADGPGFAIARNPGVSVLYETTGSEVVPDGRGDVLLRLFAPTSLSFWREGRTATREEILSSIESGLPLLESQCDDCDGNRIEDLRRAYAQAVALLPAEGGAA
ncbi:MAG: hypothetical protein KF873_02155 [Gemmataceae bacterium]|nr:hypothetical protein [Gemmataceae bacterium]